MNNLQKRKRAFMSLITRPFGFIRTISGVLPLSLPYVIKGSALDYSFDWNTMPSLNDFVLTNSGINLWERGSLEKISVTSTVDIDLPPGTYTLSAVIESDASVGATNTELVEGESYLLAYKASDGGTIGLGRIKHNTGKVESSTFTLSEAANSFRIYAARTVAASAGKTYTATSIQIQKGLIASEYEPYREPVYVTINKNEQLPELPLFEGTNVLSVEGDVQPEMTVTYKASVKGV